MNYQALLEKAMAIFNEKKGTSYSMDNIVIGIFTTENHRQVFERFCSAYFSEGLSDRYMEVGYFDFRAASFVGWNNDGKDGILLRTDIHYTPMELQHIFLHELAHIFCAHHELSGRSFYDEYCEGYAATAVEDGIINAGYAVWRECIAEVIAIECDDNCVIRPLESKRELIGQFKKEITPDEGKLAVSEILIEVMTSAEIEMSDCWDTAEMQIRKQNLFTMRPELDLMKVIYTQLRDRLIEVDIDFISEVGHLYLNILSMTMLQRFGEILERP